MVSLCNISDDEAANNYIFSRETGWEKIMITIKKTNSFLNKSIFIDITITKKICYKKIDS